MKEDILEQIVDDYLQLKGYFTIHNVRFKPSPGHSEFVGSGNPISFLTLSEMWTEYVDAVGTTPQPSEIGRLAQLLKAAGVGS